MSKIFGNRKQSDGEMTFLDHLEELRWHIIRSVIAIVVFALIAFFNKELIFDGIILAPKNNNFLTYRILCALSRRFNLDMCFDKIDFSVINFDMSGQFTTHMWVAFMAGFILAFPYFVWEMWRFIKPALSDREKNFSTGFVVSVTGLFLSGLLFGYFVITPLSINFLGNYQISNEVKNTISLSSYINIVTVMSLSTGLVFELPVIVYFLSRAGIISPAFMRKYRRHAMVVNLIIAAVITPSPDVTSQLLVAIPLFLLYEISIFVSASVARKRAAIMNV